MASYHLSTSSAGMEKKLSRCGTLWLIRFSFPSKSKLQNSDTIHETITDEESSQLTTLPDNGRPIDLLESMSVFGAIIAPIHQRR